MHDRGLSKPIVHSPPIPSDLSQPGATDESQLQSTQTPVEEAEPMVLPTAEEAQDLQPETSRKTTTVYYPDTVRTEALRSSSKEALLALAELIDERKARWEQFLKTLRQTTDQSIAESKDDRAYYEACDLGLQRLRVWYFKRFKCLEAKHLLKNGNDETEKSLKHGGGQIDTELEDEFDWLFQEVTAEAQSPSTEDTRSTTHHAPESPPPTPSTSEPSTPITNCNYGGYPSAKRRRALVRAKGAREELDRLNYERKTRRESLESKLLELETDLKREGKDMARYQREVREGYTGLGTWYMIEFEGLEEKYLDRKG